MSEPIPYGFLDDTTTLAEDGASIVAAAINGGFSVSRSSLGSPKEVTALYREARALGFPVEAIESGLPSDFRAILTRPVLEEGTEAPPPEFLRVPTNGTVNFAQGQALITKAPVYRVAESRYDEAGNPIPPINPNLSPYQEVWTNAETGQDVVVFTWDGSVESFVELISSFQIRGNLLKKVNLVPNDSGSSDAIARVYSYKDEKEYSVMFLQGAVFTTNAIGHIVLLSRSNPSYLVKEIGFNPNGSTDFQFTPFSQSLYNNGIDLMPEEEESKPWYKTGGGIAGIIALVALLALILFLVFGGGKEVEEQVQSDPQSSESVEEEVPDNLPPPLEEVGQGNENKEDEVIPPREEPGEIVTGESSSSDNKEGASDEEKEDSISTPGTSTDTNTATPDNPGTNNSQGSGNSSTDSGKPIPLPVDEWTWPWSGDDGWHWPWENTKSETLTVVVEETTKVGESVVDGGKVITEKVTEDTGFLWPWQEGFV